MDRIRDISAHNGMFVDGNDAAGIEGSIVNALWMNGVQEELVAGLIEAAGLTPDLNDNTLIGKAIAILMTGRLIAVRRFTAPGVVSYAPTAGTRLVIVHIVGGGGGGGAAIGASTGSDQGSAGGGGGSGGYVRLLLNAGFSGVPITVGAAGAGGTPSGSVGSGGTSSFGTFGSAAGGSVGSTAPSSSGTQIYAWGVPGAAYAGAQALYTSAGSVGGLGIIANNAYAVSSGAGAASFFGAGGASVGAASGGQSGNPASGFGAGGGGASSRTYAGVVGSSYAGGAGMTGAVFVEEYT